MKGGSKEWNSMFYHNERPFGPVSEAPPGLLLPSESVFEYPVPDFLHGGSVFGYPEQLLPSYPGSSTAQDERPSTYVAGSLLKRNAQSPIGNTCVSNVPPGPQDAAYPSAYSVDFMSKMAQCSALQEPISQCSTVDTSHEATDPCSVTPNSRPNRGLVFDDLSADGLSTPVLEGEGMLFDFDVADNPGSAGHRTNQCKPCAFFHKDVGCDSGKDCSFCHICQPGEKKLRKKAKSAQVRYSRRFQVGHLNPFWPQMGNMIWPRT
jgi:hypothetical protein